MESDGGGDGRRPSAVPEGGDPVCWLDQVCPSCGRLVGDDVPVCPFCEHRFDEEAAR